MVMNSSQKMFGNAKKVEEGELEFLQNGGVFEKGGVNISKVYGKLPKSMQSYFKVGDVDFFACGLSLVMHPKNPMTPTVHANWRYFEMYDKSGEIIDQWFGGDWI